MRDLNRHFTVSVNLKFIQIEHYPTRYHRYAIKGNKIAIRVWEDNRDLKMAMRSFFNEIRGMKVKDVPKHVKPMVTTSNAKNFIQRALDNYHAKYIQTDSIVPLYHVCFGGMIFSYLVALPEERRHLEHQQHAKGH
ncbi:hypothetical protein Hanom_Chr06g00579641 [Helianthus anomalus]